MKKIKNIESLIIILSIVNIPQFIVATIYSNILTILFLLLNITMLSSLSIYLSILITKKIEVNEQLIQEVEKKWKDLKLIMEWDMS